jgi:hypothetical protein
MHLDNFWNLLNCFTHNYLVPNLLGYYGYVPIVKTYNSKIWQDYELSIKVWSIIVHSKALELRFGLKKHHGQEIGWWPQKKTTTSDDI